MGFGALAASVAVHVVLLWLQWFSSEPAGAGARTLEVAEPLQVRLVEVPLAGAAVIRASEQADVFVAQQSETTIDARDGWDLPHPSAPAEGVSITHDASAIDDLAPPPKGTVYLPRTALTRSPQPLTDPVVSVPAGHGPAGEQRGVFSLFISASGGVDSVVRDGPTLAPALEAAALEVLRGTRFIPGELDGVAVAALIRIEMAFENRAPVDPPAPVIVSQQPL